jgi:F-type H+-transporting ATPase subunit delta
MPRRGSAKRYAQALFDLAVERDQVDGWAEDLILVDETLRDEELRTFLEHAKIPLQRKISAIGEAFRQVDPMVTNVLSLLVSRGMVDLVSEVSEGYQRLLNELRNREQVEVWSAVPLEDQERERVARVLTGLIDKEVIVESHVDSSMIGGLVIKVGDKLIDGSTRKRLADLGEKLQTDVAVLGE